MTALKWWWNPETQSPCDAVAVAAEERDLAARHLAAQRVEREAQVHDRQVRGHHDGADPAPGHAQHGLRLLGLLRGEQPIAEAREARPQQLHVRRAGAENEQILHRSLLRSPLPGSRWVVRPTVGARA